MTTLLCSFSTTKSTPLDQLQHHGQNSSAAASAPWTELLCSSFSTINRTPLQQLQHQGQNSSAAASVPWTELLYSSFSTGAASAPWTALLCSSFSTMDSTPLKQLLSVDQGSAPRTTLSWSVIQFNPTGATASQLLSEAVLDYYSKIVSTASSEPLYTSERFSW
ncbi:hypothetical protein EOD39_18517 [Acipenser ruthenus]|uniref:Uncharacterized protein n=1 Tax=Acipenser ruthenus TaxID=7906 RepID=A0A444V0K0_ACIRT|nr:hypothetical protein EOD39_18517 [Acipenser ruthenus]